MPESMKSFFSIVWLASIGAIILVASFAAFLMSSFLLLVVGVCALPLALASFLTKERIKSLSIRAQSNVPN